MTDEKTWLMEYMETFAAARGLALPPGAAERFYRYAAFLLAQNEKMNLTALKTLQAVADGHFLDSLAPAAMGLIPDCLLYTSGSGKRRAGRAVNRSKTRKRRL